MAVTSGLHESPCVVPHQAVMLLTRCNVYSPIWTVCYVYEHCGLSSRDFFGGSGVVVLGVAFTLVLGRSLASVTTVRLWARDADCRLWSCSFSRSSRVGVTLVLTVVGRLLQLQVSRLDAATPPSPPHWCTSASVTSSHKHICICMITHNGAILRASKCVF